MQFGGFVLREVLDKIVWLPFPHGNNNIRYRMIKAEDICFKNPPRNSLIFLTEEWRNQALNFFSAPPKKILLRKKFYSEKNSTPKKIYSKKKSTPKTIVLQKLEIQQIKCYLWSLFHFNALYTVVRPALWICGGKPCPFHLMGT